jgi:hypothetical protein
LSIQFDGPSDSGGTNMVRYSAMFRVAGTEDDWTPFDSEVAAPVNPDTTVVMLQEGLTADTLYELTVVGYSEFPPRPLPGVVSVVNKGAIALTSVSWVGVVDPGSSFRIAGFDAIVTVGDGTAVHDSYVELSEVFRGDDMMGPAVEVGAMAPLVTMRTGSPSPPGPPSQPVLLRVSGGMATLTTMAPRDTGGVPLTAYVAFVSVEASVADPLVFRFPRPAVPTAPLQFDVPGLTPRTTYDLVVYAENIVSQCSSSSRLPAASLSVKFTTGAPTPPTPPLNVVQVGKFGGKIQFAWDPPHDVVRWRCNPFCCVH